MRILFLTPQLPYPPYQGTSLRNYNLIRSLAERHEVHLLSFIQPGDDLARASPLKQLCRTFTAVPAPRRSPLHRFLSLLFSPQPDMALRLPSQEFHTRLGHTLREQALDVVQVEGIEMAQYGLWLMVNSHKPSAIGHQPSAISHRPLAVFDDHNAEYVLQRTAFQSDVRQPTRWMAAFYSFVQWHKLARYERWVCRHADRVVAVSEADARAIEQLVPDLEVAVVPNGVDTEHYRPRSQLPTSKSLVFTGKMDFRPNVDAVLWFCQEILPFIIEQIPEVHFYVVGQQPHSRLSHLADQPHVTLTGRVDDVRPYIAGAGVYVVPLRMGSGTRLKVLQAMAMGQAIVSTSLGCEGISLCPGREAVLADTPPDFARQVVALLSDVGRRKELGRNARLLAETHYDWRVIVPGLEKVYEEARAGR
ncbi:MAG: glycosyltransferase [Anaerolineae bacterium]